MSVRSSGIVQFWLLLLIGNQRRILTWIIRLNSRNFRDHICLRAQGTPLGVGGCLEGIWEFSKILGKFGNLLNPSADARFQKKVAAKPPEIKER